MDLDQLIVVPPHPDLRGPQVVVGGDGGPTKRGVVATASCEARLGGVRSRLPMRTAPRRCQDAVFPPSDRAAYEEASAQVIAVLYDLSPAPEPRLAATPARARIPVRPPSRPPRIPG